MGKTKKAGIKKDNSARIARGAARKAKNREANALAHLRNEEQAELLGIKPGRGKDRPSVAIRRHLRIGKEQQC